MNILERIVISKCSLRFKTKILRKHMAHIGENVAICNSQFGKEPYLIWIEDDVIVATGVQFVTHDASYYNAYRFIGVDGDPKTERMGRIILKRNCFIGINSIILPGVTVGKNSVVAAGSIVNRSIPDNEVWGGVPAHFIMTMSEYSSKIINEVDSLPWRDSDVTGLELQNKRKEYYLMKHIENENTNIEK